MDSTVIYCEGGINWAWYTKLTVHDDTTVTILRHWRLHKFDDLCHPDSIVHSNYYRETIWRETSDRTAIMYYVPNKGWHRIRNPKHVFDYTT